MKIVYACETFPESFESSLFLGGLSPRDAPFPHWHLGALDKLRSLDYQGVVFVPETRDGSIPNITEKLAWEGAAMNMSDQIVFWMVGGLTETDTGRDAFGYWRARDPLRIVFGSPANPFHADDAEALASEQAVACFTDPDLAVEHAVVRIRKGILRCGGERCIPLHLHRLASFRQWLDNQKTAGNRLDDARVEWVYRVGPARQYPFFWSVWVSVWVASENRHKANEVVIGRTDISATVAWCAVPPFNNLHETRIVLVGEFRSTVSNKLGRVLEIPGGSAPKPGREPRQIASDEFHEETGLHIGPERFVERDVRQLAATMSAHRAFLYSVELTPDEINQLAEDGASGKIHGDGVEERTRIEVKTVGEMTRDPNIDWSTMGMVMKAIM